MNDPRPPRLAERLLSLLVPASCRGLEGDLAEEFYGRIARGQALDAARRRYWQEVLRAAPALVRVQGQEWLRTGWVPASVGALAAIVWFGVSYAVLAGASETGVAPLGDLSFVAFLVIWVFGGGFIGSAVGTLVRPAAVNVAAASVGLFVAAIVVMGIDAPLAFSVATMIAATAFSGALAGAHAGAALS